MRLLPIFLLWLSGFSAFGACSPGTYSHTFTNLLDFNFLPLTFCVPNTMTIRQFENWYGTNLIASVPVALVAHDVYGPYDLWLQVLSVGQPDSYSLRTVVVRCHGLAVGTPYRVEGIQDLTFPFWFAFSNFTATNDWQDVRLRVDSSYDNCFFRLYGAVRPPAPVMQRSDGHLVIFSCGLFLSGFILKRAIKI
jgi:hypothetical protein